MAIRIEQPGLAGLYGAAAVLSKQEAEARRAQEQAARRQDIQEQRQYQQNVKLLDTQLDLEMYERSKRWEIDKMELRSQMDFQREEQLRQRKMDSIDSAIQQIDKEVLAGRMTEQEAKPIKLKYEMEKMGIDIPISLLPGREREEAGLPWYMREAYKEFPEAQAIRERMITGKVDPTQQLIQRFLAGGEAEEVEPVKMGRVRVISPTGQTGTIEASEVESFRAKGFTIIGETATDIAGVRKPMDIRTKPFRGFSY